MTPQLSRKFKNLALTCLFGCFAGVIYQFINEELVDYRSLLIGFSMGFVFGILELFIFPRTAKHLRRWSFTRLLVFKTILYTAVIYSVSIILMIIAGLLESRKMSELPALAFSIEQVSLVVFTLVVYGCLLFLIQVNRLLGQGILWKFIRGQYHQPREEERIFMFLDMRSSTSIAEKLGHARFYELMNELFHELSQPVLETKAEIYQYVGDEVILTWKMKEGLENSNCLKSFFLFQAILVKHAGHYLENFGLEPQFKAGFHFGRVITAQIGDLKREIVYNGDVLNTTARIQSECNHYKRNCLVSGALKDLLDGGNGFHWEKLDTVTLRGKETEVDLYSVSEHYLRKVG